MSLLSRIAVEAARGFGILSSRSNNISANFLVVAGGGGTSIGGGGGGGFRTSAGTSGGGASAESTLTLAPDTTYAVTVGAGGALYTKGSNSVFSTITSEGGGRGSDGSDAGTLNGGSGGGGRNVSGGTGTANQGFNGGSSSSTFSGGGGGGASQVGSNSSGTTGAVGGNGVASSISGSSVTYAGGGGGGGQTGGGAAGSGGGGAGGTGGSPGTANTGGGAGGGYITAGSTGGSGIVIISYTSATPRFVGGTLTTSGGNQIHTFTSSGTLSPITPITASYLVVAGGGGSARQLGGYAGNGGGGAGGLLSGSTTIYSGSTYVVTVGAGGAGGTTSGVAPSGSNSVLSGTGLTTLTSTGGGGGGGSTGPGANGGSGGGGSGEGTKAGGTGTSGQGNNGGNGVNAGGGGGGSGAAGSVAVTITGGAGGVGTSSSISGTATYYAGGGGGGAYSSGTAGTGGNGGGGNGGAGTSNTGNTPGTANTGGGAGGTAGDPATAVNGQTGGSGIVIISYAGSQAFNGGLVTSSGGNTIHTFTSTGALTPLTNNLTNSLRFRSSASAYLSRTPTLAGSRTTWTWSAWVKRGALGSPTKELFTALSGGEFFFGTGDTLSLYDNATTYLTTTQVFRDPSAWYHIVIVWDTTQATSSNRIRMYVNGNQVTAFSTSSYPAQNTTSSFNNNTLHNIGEYFGGGSYYFDGYMADINFIDGQALEPYYFGNNDANGVWKPILYKGTYGTNGFYLTFGNTTSTTTLGYDSSPNGNNWTTNNISLTAGTTYDAMLDVPTNTSATVANYCVLNPLVASTTATITGANLNATGSTTTFANARATFTLSSGKWYWEQTITGSSTFDIGIGLCTEASQKSSATNIRQTGWYNVINGAPGDVGSSANGGANVNISTTNWATNDIIMVAYDADTGYIWFGRNGTWYPPTTGGSAGNPAAGTNQTISAVTNLIPASWHYNTNASTAVNFGQRPFSYSVPSGFTAVNTFNLPTPTILQGNKYMDATLYTGNGTSQTITTASSFKPDLVWIKGRSYADFHTMFDTVRGATKSISSNLTTAEVTRGNALTAFTSTGFTVGYDTLVNYNGQTTVAWQWQAGQGTNTTNTAGSITSTVSVNTTAGFSVVTYTGTGSNATVGHGLGVAPRMIIAKGRTNVDNWPVYHASANASPATGHLLLNTTAAFTSTSTTWNNTAPTSTVFTVGTDTRINQNTIGYVAYCFAEIAGFSAFGSYTGNGSTDGPFVYLGFRPKFVMVKEYTQAGDYWMILDTSRDTYNVASAQIYPNASSAESSTGTLDMLSNGFKLRYTGGYGNNSGQSYIYMAFAENPFKNSNAR